MLPNEWNLAFQSVIQANEISCVSPPGRFCYLALYDMSGIRGSLYVGGQNRLKQMDIPIVKKNG